MDAGLLAALMVIDNVLSHEPGISPYTPPYAPPMVRELLAHPRDAQDAETIFRHAVPAPLIGLVNQPERMAPRPFRELLDGYLYDLQAIQQRFQRAVAPFDEGPLLRRLQVGLASADQLLQAGAGVNALQLELTQSEFILATLRFAQSLRVATDFPTQAMQLDSPIGLISIGTAGNQRHRPAAALIIDPRGAHAS